MSPHNELITWYRQFKKEQTNSIDTNMANFIMLELEKRYPFLKEIKT